MHIPPLPPPHVPRKSNLASESIRSECFHACVTDQSGSIAPIRTRPPHFQFQPQQGGGVATTRHVRAFNNTNNKPAQPVQRSSSGRTKSHATRTAAPPFTTSTRTTRQGMPSSSSSSRRTAVIAGAAAASALGTYGCEVTRMKLLCPRPPRSLNPQP
jgi:hypothetical protein